MPTTPSPFLPLRLIGDRRAVQPVAPLAHRTPMGAHLRRSAVRSLCPLLGGTVPRWCLLADHPNGVSLPLLVVASVWRTSENAVTTKFAERGPPKLVHNEE